MSALTKSQPPVPRLYRGGAINWPVMTFALILTVALGGFLMVGHGPTHDVVVNVVRQGGGR